MICRLGPDQTDLVNKWAGQYAPGCDFSIFMDDPLNVCLAEGEGGAMFAWRGPGIYEVHVFFEQRGRAALDVCAAMLETMRRDYKAAHFWTAVPEYDRRAIMFTRLMGWKAAGFADFPHGHCQLFVSEKLICRH